MSQSFLFTVAGFMPPNTNFLGVFRGDCIGFWEAFRSHKSTEIFEVLAVLVRAEILAFMVVDIFAGLGGTMCPFLGVVGTSADTFSSAVIPGNMNNWWFNG